MMGFKFAFKQVHQDQRTTSSNSGGIKLKPLVIHYRIWSQCSGFIVDFCLAYISTYKLVTKQSYCRTLQKDASEGKGLIILTTD